jgi:RNase P subunit RPR2
MIKNKQLSKQEIKDYLNHLFSSNPSQKQIKKAKRLAMSKNIKLRGLRKTFCKKCYSFFDSKNSEIRIKKGFKIIRCKKCESITKYKLK